ncbi:hypothetical protein [Escherichia phage E20-1]|nr:hypothetical protein [Escherichia phage E20-1]
MKRYSVWFNEVEEGFDEVGGWVNILNTDDIEEAEKCALNYNSGYYERNWEHDEILQSSL